MLRLQISVLLGIVYCDSPRRHCPLCIVCTGDNAVVGCRSPRRQFCRYILHSVVNGTEHTWSAVQEIDEAWYIGMVVPIYMLVHFTSTRACTVYDWDGCNTRQAEHGYCVLGIALEQVGDVLFIDGTARIFLNVLLMNRYA